MMRFFRAALRQILLLAFGLLVLFPLIYGILGAFKAPQEFTLQPPTVLPRSFGYLDNFRTVFRTVPVPRFLLNSLISALMTSVVRMLLAMLAAYAFAFFEFRGKRFLFFLLLGTMMFPAETLTIGNYRTVAKLGLINTYRGMGIVSFVGASQMLMLRQRFRSFPAAVYDAARLDGCGDLRFLFGILLPMSIPLVMMLFLQSFIAQWNAYLWPLLVTNRNEMRTVQVGITMLTKIDGTNYETILAGVTLALIPSVILFLLLRRRMTQAMVTDAEP